MCWRRDPRPTNPRPKHHDKKKIHNAEPFVSRQKDIPHAYRALDLDGRVRRRQGRGTGGGQGVQAHLADGRGPHGPNGAYFPSAAPLRCHRLLPPFEILEVGRPRLPLMSQSTGESADFLSGPEKNLQGGCEASRQPIFRGGMKEWEKFAGSWVPVMIFTLGFPGATMLRVLRAPLRLLGVEVKERESSDMPRPRMTA